MGLLVDQLLVDQLLIDQQLIDQLLVDQLPPKGSQGIARESPRGPEKHPSSLKGTSQGVPRGPKGVPEGCQKHPSRPQGIPRDPKAFCNKNKQSSLSIRHILKRGTSKLERQHHFWKMSIKPKEIYDFA